MEADFVVCPRMIVGFDKAMQKADALGSVNTVSVLTSKSHLMLSIMWTQRRFSS